MRDKRVSNFIQTALLAILSILVIYPIVWLISNSLKTPAEMVTRSWRLIPNPVVWENYPEAWEIGRIGQSLSNSATVSIIAVIILILSAFLASYALARIRFTGRNIILVMFISMWMMPLQIFVIPLFRLMSFFEITNSLYGMALPYAAASLPFAIFVLSTFIRSLPVEIEEAGFIDGASRLQIIVQIVAPLCKPAISAVIIFSVLSFWNELFLALVLLRDPALRTLPVAVLAFNGQWGHTDFTRLYAALVIACIPTIIVYLIFQRQFVAGLTSGAVKA